MTVDVRTLKRGGSNAAGIIARLQAAMFADDFPGYQPGVVEIPDGKGEADTGKRYSHLTQSTMLHDMGEHSAFLSEVWVSAYSFALTTHRSLRLPGDFAPDPAECCLRLIEYPAGATSAPHTDFNLFTMNLWRHPEACMRPNCRPVHMGELAELVDPRFCAERHRVEASSGPQVALVFFVLPARSAILPSGRSVGEWLDERKARSRVAA